MYKAKVTIKNGTLVGDSDFAHYLASIEGETKMVELKRFVKKRTSGQPDEETNANGYYWHVLSIISEYQGNTKDELHEIFTNMFAPYTNVFIGNSMVKNIVRTSEMNGSQFYAYVEEIRAFVKRTLNISTPEPHNYANNKRD